MYWMNQTILLIFDKSQLKIHLYINFVVEFCNLLRVCTWLTEPFLFRSTPLHKINCDSSISGHFCGRRWNNTHTSELRDQTGNAIILIIAPTPYPHVQWHSDLPTQIPSLWCLMCTWCPYFSFCKVQNKILQRSVLKFPQMKLCQPYSR